MHQDWFYPKGLTSSTVSNRQWEQGFSQVHRRDVGKGRGFQLKAGEFVEGRAPGLGAYLVLKENLEKLL